MPSGGRGGGRGQGAAGAALGLNLSYRVGDGDWTNLSTRGAKWSASPEAGTVSYASNEAGVPIKVVETYKTDGNVLDWTIDLESTGKTPGTIGDLGISVPVVGPTGENPIQIFERGFLKHQFVSGNGSFFYFVRASGAPPFLLVTVSPARSSSTSAAAAAAAGRRFTSIPARPASAETRGTWRQAHTSLDLAPAGRPGSKAAYGFRMQWADSYEELRDMLYQAGLFDIRVVPGMTVPENLTARISLHTKARIEAIQAEFPGRRQSPGLGQAASPDTQVYEVAFKKLGENMLTIKHDGGRQTYLEFFVTEPMETLIKKRAAFLVNRQQIKDPTKWWNGVYGTVRHDGQGHAHDRGSGHLPGPHGVRS